MVAGLNMRVRIIAMTQLADDEYGGSMVTGTVAYESVQARLQALKPDPLLLQQGLETQQLIRCLIQPSTTDVKENDQVEVIWPTQSPYYGERFRVIKIQRDAIHPLDRRNAVELTLSRMQYSRSEIYQ